MCPIYRYCATDWSGRKHRGRQSAPGVTELLESLNARGFTVIELREEKGLLRLAPDISRWWEQLRHGKAGSRDLMIFCLQFATLLRAGMSALNALQILAGQVKQAAFRRRLEAVAAGIARGNSLSASFQEHTAYFPEILVHMLEAGEAGGALEEVLERLAEHFERQHNLEEKIRSATVYPLFIIAVAAVVLVVMVFFVLPQFGAVFGAMGLEMPLFATMLLQASEALRRHWLPCLLLLLLTATGLRFCLATELGRLFLDRIMLRLPIFGSLYRHTLAARFARVMAVLLDSGLNLLPALALVERVLNNRPLARALKQTRDAVSQGQPVADPLQKSGLFPSLLVEMVRIGEAGGALAEMLNRSAGFYEREIAFTASRLGSMLEPVLLLLVGLFVGALVFSILSPMYRIFETL